MKIRQTTKFKVTFVFLSFSLECSRVLAQGSLTPPGPPGATMLTLAQIEPRTPISSVPFTITTPGSYYLTTNLVCTVSNAIVIAANGVTLDLNGFTISSIVANAANGGTAILLGGSDSRRNITIQNGYIQSGVTNNSGVYSGPGFAYGIYSGAVPVNVHLNSVLVSGCLFSGIYLGYGNTTVVESCTVQTAGNYGIVASTIKGSVARDCNSIAIEGNQVSDCRGESGTGDGLDAAMAQNCYGLSSSGTGLNAAAALNCYGSSFGGDGLDATTALNCYGSTSGVGYGIYTDTAQNCECINNGSGTGLYATTAENCRGSSTGGSYGINADTVQNCYGYNGNSYGIYATTAENCHGISGNGIGLYAFRSAIGCFGQSSSATGVGLYVQTGVTLASFGYNSTSTGLGLQAYVATGCYGQNTSGTSESINNQYNMP